MSFQPPWRRPCVLASALVAAGIVLGVAGCDVTPLGPTRAPQHTVQTTPVPLGSPMPVGTIQVDKLGSPIVLQVMRNQSPAAAGACPAGSVEVSRPPGAAPLSCYRPAGMPVTITAAAVSPVSSYRPAAPPGQPAQPVAYGFTVGVPAAEVGAVTALIQQAYDSQGALGVSVDGELWEAPQVDQPFSGQQLQVSLLSRNQALQLYRLLVPHS